MKDKLDEKIMKKFATLRPKTYSYLIDDSAKSKGIGKCVIKAKLKFENYKHCLEAAQIENKINQLENINFMWIVFDK